MKRLLPCILVIAASAYIMTPIVDPDLWWHITVGRWIMANGTVPHFDHWNSNNVPWVAYSWSFEATLALFESIFGFSALSIVKFALLLSFGLLLQRLFVQFSKERGIGTALAIFVICACFDHSLLRPQLVSWLLFVLVILLGDVIGREGLTRKRAIAALLIFIVWGNLHLTFLFGLLVFAVYVWRASWRDSLLSLVLAMLGTVVGPYGHRPWAIVLEKSAHPLMFKSIVEFQPAGLMEYSTSFQLILLSLLVSLFILGPRPRPYLRLATSLSFMALGFFVVKFQPYSFIIAAALISERWGASCDREKDYRGLAEGLSGLQQRLSSLPLPLVYLLALLVVGVKVQEILVKPIDKSRQPAAEVSFIIDNNLPEPMLNNFGDGGYLIYRFSDSEGKPQRLVTLDGRTNVNDYFLMEAYQDAQYGSPENLFEFLKPESALLRNKWPLAKWLLRDPEWCLVKGDIDNRLGWSVLVKKDWLLKQQRVSYSGC